MPVRSFPYLLLLLACSLLQAKFAFGDVPSAVNQDQIVLVSTRDYPSTVGRMIPRGSFVGEVCNPKGFHSSQQVDLLAPHPFEETWVFVHGNQISSKMAIERGTRVYRSMRCRSHLREPIRFVIYSWPSERETCRLIDAGIKTKRTNAEAFFFGSFLTTIARQGPLNVIAYSFGARVACGGLHLLHGGCLDGYYLPSQTTPSGPIRVTMLAAAVENDGILPGGRYERAMNSTDRLLLLNNSRDKALLLFWVIDRSRPAALGRTGLKSSLPRCFTTQYDWEETFGRDHSIWNYFDRPIIVDRVLENFAR